MNSNITQVFENSLHFSNKFEFKIKFRRYFSLNGKFKLKWLLLKNFPMVLWQKCFSFIGYSFFKDFCFTKWRKIFFLNTEIEKKVLSLHTLFFSVFMLERLQMTCLWLCTNEVENEGR